MARLSFAVGELWATLKDAWQLADLAAHLRAWWQIVSQAVPTD
jgi:hypothetical protein